MSEITNPDDIEVIMNCTKGGCGTFVDAERCGRCGFNREEAERRKGLPMIRGADGLWRKYVWMGRRSRR